MLRNYIKIAFRNLVKYKFISFINLFGLTVGLTCCLLILAYIINELSYDQYNKNAKNIYRVSRTFMNPETSSVSLQLGAVAPPVAPLLLNDFKDIKKITRFLSNGTVPMRYEEKMFNEKGVYFADENVFSVFDISVTKGNPAKALNNPFSIMLTEEVARKYFGDADPVNKVLRLDNQFDLNVTGVFKPLPANSHVHPNVLISFNTLNDTAIYGAEQLRTNWGNNSFFTYLLLPDNYNYKNLEAQFPAFLNRHIDPSGGGSVKPSDWSKLLLQPLTDIHLHSQKDDELEQNGDIKLVYVFSAIALFILLIACINYMNLSTARSVLRAKEIGIRKVVGAARGELIAQFLSESILISWLATVLAFAITILTLPWLNKISGQALSIDILLSWKVIVPVLILPFLIGIFSGIYPAFFLSSFQPVKVLKGVMKIGGNSISLRKILVVTQFSISIILIISTAIAFQQLKYMHGKSLGFDREQIIILPYSTQLAKQYEAFKTQLLSDASIKDIGRSSRIPTGRLLDANGSQINRGDSLAPTKADIKMVRTDDGFITTYGIKVAAGRNFSRDFGTDSTSFIINEAAVKVLGLKSNNDAIGKGFQYGDRKGQLVGVINDFHFESLHQRIVPMVFFIPDHTDSYNRVSVKLAGNNVKAALSHVEKTWKKFLPDVPYDFIFLDDNFASLYESEERQAGMFTVFAFIAIFIGCLGLFGLSAFAITQRIKEIGIRKVLGASVGSIVSLLSKDFIVLVLVAAVIAFPVAWFAMHQWLQDFAYRVNISWSVFILAAAIASCVALFTISFQAIKAALANPVKSLRSE